MFLCACTCVCVWEREREREHGVNIEFLKVNGTQLCWLKRNHCVKVGHCAIVQPNSTVSWTWMYMKYVQFVSHIFTFTIGDGVWSWVKNNIVKPFESSDWSLWKQGETERERENCRFFLCVWWCYPWMNPVKLSSGVILIPLLINCFLIMTVKTKHNKCQNFFWPATALQSTACIWQEIYM